MWTDLPKVDKPWGYEITIFRDSNYWTKILTIYSGESLSLHYHENRDEYLKPYEGGLILTVNGATNIKMKPWFQYSLPANVIHRITNPQKHSISVVEVAVGSLETNDIIRIHDKYRRCE